MVNEEQKDVIFNSASEDFTTASCRFVPHHDCHEGFSVQLIFPIVKHFRIIYVVTIGIVENFAWERVLLCSGNVVARHENYLLRVETLLYQDLVGVEGISLVPIVVISATTSDNHSPVICLN